MIVTIRNIQHRKELYKKFTYSAFCDMFRWQEPYRSLKPIDRDKALQADWDLLKPDEEVKKVIKKETPQ
jgi:hypothetical protein